MAFLLLLSARSALGVEWAGRFSPDGSPLGLGLGVLVHQWRGLRTLSLTRVTLTLNTSRVRGPPFRSTNLTGCLTPFLLWFLESFEFLPFYVAFIFIMPPFAAISARYRAAGKVLVLYLLTIFSVLRVLRLEHARTSPITVGRVAGSTLIVRRTTVEKIRAPLPLGGGSQSCASAIHYGPSKG